MRYNIGTGRNDFPGCTLKKEYGKGNVIPYRKSTEVTL